MAQGYSSKVLTANNVGVQLGLVAPSKSAVPTIQGILHSVSFGADATAQTISIYDGTSTAGTLIFQTVTTAASQASNFVLDIQATVGLFLVVAGGTTPNVTVTFA